MTQCEDGDNNNGILILNGNEDDNVNDDNGGNDNGSYIG